MTSATSDRPPVAVVAPAALVVRWRVSAVAWPHASPAGEDPSLVLTIHPLSETTAEVSADYPGRTAELRCPATLRRDGDLLHIEAPGLLRATLRDHHVLWATTPLLAAHSLRGGRYELRRGD